MDYRFPDLKAAGCSIAKREYSNAFLRDRVKGKVSGDKGDALQSNNGDGKP